MKYALLLVCCLATCALGDVFEKDQTQCMRAYSKIGCFNEDRSNMDLILTDRDQSHEYSSGFLLNWKEMAKSLHSLACRCSEKAREGGYKYFSIRFFAECWAGKKEHIFESLVRDRSHRSNECIDPNFVKCDDSNSEDECAGKAGNDYIFALRDVKKAEPVINGGYSEFTAWSRCSVTCGNGIMERERSCTNPKPSGKGKDCSELGSPSESKSCKVKECPVDGGFGTWKLDGVCSKLCGGGQQKYRKSCDSPAPQHGGKECAGPTTKTEECNTNACPVDGGFGSWQKSGACSKSCDGGILNYVRKCDKPMPQNGGRSCEGALSKTVACNTRSCPPKYSSTYYKYACSHKVLHLSCGVGHGKQGVIVIDYASYGRHDRRKSCGWIIFSTNCHSSKSHYEVAKRCHGKTSCSVHASTSIFGNPCSGTWKYLEVKYRCKYQ